MRAQAAHWPAFGGRPEVAEFFAEAGARPGGGAGVAAAGLMEDTI